MKRAFLIIGLSFAAAAAKASEPQSAFGKAMDDAMSRMMADMHVSGTGDVDRDFAVMMIPHHRGAIDMAVAELKYGRNVQLMRIAQEIIIDQQQEITAMRLAIGAPLPLATPAPTGPTLPSGTKTDGDLK